MKQPNKRVKKVRRLLACPNCFKKLEEGHECLWEILDHIVSGVADIMWRCRDLPGSAGTDFLYKYNDMKLRHVKFYSPPKKKTK